MSVIITCSSCGQHLSVGDDLLDKRVCCASCGHTFQAVAAPAPTPAASAEAPLEDLATKVYVPSLGSPASAPPPLPDEATPLGRDRPKRVAETCPHCDEEVDEKDVRCQRCGERLSQEEREPRRRARDWEDEDDRRPLQRRRRRDSEPHRGTLVLVLGIMSLVCMVFGILGAPVGLILGIVAIIMSASDLRAMKADQMDSEGEGLTKAAWILGLIGTILNALFLLLVTAGIVFFIIMAATHR